MIIVEIPKCPELKNGDELAIYDYPKYMGVESINSAAEHKWAIASDGDFQKVVSECDAVFKFFQICSCSIKTDCVFFERCQKLK